MAIFIDPPVWPAHGTLFSHLISDFSLDELHAFANRGQVSPRAFDRDHYDVPGELYQDLVELGAEPVSGTELVRILAASGLRIAARERQNKVRKNLQRGWGRLGAKLGQEDHPRWLQIGEDLLGRWSEPHRNYHALPHLASVLRGVGLVERAGELPGSLRGTVLLAAWFHDAVYVGQAGQDEEDSALLAEEQLDGLLPAETVNEVAWLVRLTASHTPQQHDAAGAALLDADLEVLSRTPGAYQRYVAAVRADYAHVSDADFADGRAQVLRHLLRAPRLFHTYLGHTQWEPSARSNLGEELRLLDRGDQPWV